MRSILRAPLIALALAAFLSPATAGAQDFERRLPQPPPQTPVPDVPVPPELAPAADDSTQLLPELKAVLFVGGMDAVQADGVAPETVAGGVEARGLPLLAEPAFLEQVRPYLGRPLTRGDLNAITRLVQETYRATEHPFVDVSVPPQNVQRGAVQIVVTEYRVGEIGVSGNRHFSTNLILRMSELEPGQTLTLPLLREALRDYNSNPFLEIDGVLRPGAQTGTTDVLLEAHDRLPLRVYAGYDNQGVPTLGRDEWYVGFNWGNVLGTGHILSYQFTRSFEGRYTSHSGSYVAPVSPDDQILVFGAYATQEPFLSDAFRSTGHSWQVSGRFVHEMIGRVGLRTTLQGGFDFKRTDNNLDFLGFRVLDTVVDIVQFPLTFTATIDDRLGETVINNLFVFSPGNVTDHNTDFAMRLLVPFSDATYVYDRLSLTRTTWLPQDFSWVIRAMGQVATSNLPYSEQLAAGGLGSVRGYDPNTALGSEGLLLKTELVTPAFSVLASKGNFADQIQFGLFFDYAKVWQNRRLPDSPRNAELASVGVYAHYTAGRHLDLEVDLGHQLMRAPFRFERDTRFAIVATIGF